MTADVEALMSCREFAQNSAQIHTEAPYAERATAETEANDPTLDAAASGPSAEFAQNSAQIHTEAVYAKRAAADVPAHDPTERFATVKLVYVGPEFASNSAQIHTEGALPERVEHAATREVYSETDSQVEPVAAIAPKRSHHKRKRTKRKPRPIPTVKEVTLRPAAPRKKSHPKTQPEIDLSHHQRRCSICHHPDREAIEEAFLQWRSVRSIDLDFEPEGGRTAIYRHARALKLFKQRNLGLRSSLEFVIEQAEHVMPSAEGLVKAIRAYTRINDAGEWIDTPTTHIVKVMPMRDPEPRNVTNSASPRPDEGRGSVTLDVKKISDCPREGKVEVTIESPSGRPLLTGSASQTESGATT